MTHSSKTQQRPRNFRPYDQEQLMLLPPSLDEWLPKNHVARYISEVIDTQLDLTEIYKGYSTGAGAPSYDPRMMLKLLVYGYSTGITSSRELERRCEVDVALRYLSASALPDYRSISRFRKRHIKAFDGLFTEVLFLCQEAGLVELKRTALDGTKVRADTSRHKAVSYGRVDDKIAEIQKQVKQMLEEAEAVDQEEDERYGEDKRGDEIPPELLDKQRRLEKLTQAKESMEAYAKKQARERAEEDGGNKRQQRAAEKMATPHARMQRSFTDTDSRMMKTADGSFHYCYNTQAVVDEKSQVIVATSLTQEANDQRQLVPMVKATKERCASMPGGRLPKQMVIDAGYCSEKNLKAVESEQIEMLIATGREKRGETKPERSLHGRIPKNTTLRQRMNRKLATKAGRAAYARRKAIVEPVFGQMKTRQHAGRFRLRGKSAVTGEWMLHALCHNLRKLMNSTEGVFQPVG